MVTFQKFAILHKIKVKGTLSDTQGCRLGTEATSTASRKDGVFKVGKTAQKHLSWSQAIWREKYALEEEGVFAACKTKRCV